MYLTEKEKKQMACMQSSQESQLKAYALQIEQLKEQLEGKRSLGGGQFMQAGVPGEGFQGHNSSLQELSSKSGAAAMNHQTSLSGFSTLSSTASCAKVSFITTLDNSLLNIFSQTRANLTKGITQIYPAVSNIASLNPDLFLDLRIWRRSMSLPIVGVFEIRPSESVLS